MTLGRGHIVGERGERNRCRVGSSSRTSQSLRQSNRSARFSTRLLDLPDDVLFIILSYCDQQSLGRLAQVCQRLSHLTGYDSVWLRLRERMTQILDCRSHRGGRAVVKASVKEQCRYACNWMRGHYRDSRLIHHGVKQLPWLQLDGHNLWVSNENVIRCYRQNTDGSLRELSNKTLRGHRDDVGRFVVKNNMVVSGSRDRSIHAYSAICGEVLVKLQDCHSGDIQAVDCYQDIVVSGSRDATVKIWNLQKACTREAHQKTLEVQDRVWSLAMNPDGRSFITGTAGINNVAPLRIWDTESAQLLAVLGNQYKNGAGVLDIHYETPDTLFSCGYDTYARFWDLRTSHTHCVRMWEEPFDSTLYCVRSDGQNAIVTGTARHGLVRLWDKRQRGAIQMYYVGRRANSPVYSLAFEPGRLYVALDKGINLLDFTVPG